jgi:hypothetical protein
MNQNPVSRERERDARARDNHLPSGGDGEFEFRWQSDDLLIDLGDARDRLPTSSSRRNSFVLKINVEQPNEQNQIKLNQSINQSTKRTRFRRRQYNLRSALDIVYVRHDLSHRLRFAVRHFNDVRTANNRSITPLQTERNTQ